jgi:PKD repeat protein
VTLSAIGAGGTDTLTLTNCIVVTNPPPTGLQLASMVVTVGGAFQFVVTNADGTPITADQQSHIAIYTTTDASASFADWSRVTNSVWLTNGWLQVNDTDSMLYPLRFYRAVQAP